MTDPIPFLRTHSYYSFLESLLSPEDLAKIASQKGIEVLGMTDYRCLSGAIEFYEACLKYGLKPIIGLEMDFVFQGFHGLITCLAKDIEGWTSLSRLSSQMQVDNTPIGIHDLETSSKGLLCLMGDYRGILRELIFNSPPEQDLPNLLLDAFKEIFSEDYFLEIQRYSNGPLKNENALIKHAAGHNIRLIASQNIFYEDKLDETYYRTLTAIKTNSLVQTITEAQLPPGPAHFPEITDFRGRFDDIPEAIDNLSQISERCDLRLHLGKTHFPVFKTPTNESQAEFLRRKAYEGARSIYKKLTPKITERLDHELNIITSMGYEPIFLIVEDVLNHARHLGIPTSSRGSAASSLVAHCLNITSPDPLALNLYFERFLNPARLKPPDIDTDIASHRRDEVINYVFNKFGIDRVAMVATINRYRPKSALGDVAKAYGLLPEKIRLLSKQLPSSFRFRTNDDEGSPFTPLLQETSIPQIKNIVADAQRLLDIPRHLSVHPGGIVITPFPIKDLVPIMHSTTLGLNHTQYDLDGIGKLGLVKIDLLGIRGLTVLGEVADRIQSWRLSEFSNGLQVLDAIPHDDLDTSTLVSEARTIGCFQIESPGMRSTLREINAKSVEDIMAALALYRPGPLRGGLRDAFVRRFRGEEPVEHIHPALEGLLGSTYGVILYQEQVLRIAHELGGLSIAEADILRRAMSHFDPGGVMDTLRKNFIEGAQENRGVPLHTAERIWEMMAAFAGYGFPKAHAASYAQLAWNSAWCKAHFPAEFMSAVLGFSGGYYSQRIYIMEARRLGLSLHPPHINHSNHRFRVKYPGGEPALYMGLDQVRELTQRTIDTIIDNRPFTSFEDFLVRVNPHKKETQHLLKCGAFDGIISIPEGLKRCDRVLIPGQLILFGTAKTDEDWGPEEQSNAQQEILGVSLEISPLEKHAEQILSMGAISTLEALSRIGEKVVIAGLRQTLRRIKTKSNQLMCFLNLEDLEGSVQVIIPSWLYQKHYKALREIGPFIIEGVMEEDATQHRVHLRADKILLLK
jgi:DNA-directed DNA polymerase III PolC